VIRIGTSGWSYADWAGRFYPEDLPSKEWLPAYAARFGTVELNNSFYRLPEAATFATWRVATPERFVFAVKVSRYLTHLRRLREPQEPVERLWARASALGPKLGPLLLQLPPRFPAAPERLAATLRAFGDRARVAVEFRDASWHRHDVFRILDDAGAALVWPDRPGWRPRLPTTGGWTYVRFHQGSARSMAYPATSLARWADRIAALDTDAVWIYFNNDPGAAAPKDAAKLQELLLERVGSKVATVPGGGERGRPERVAPAPPG
jgi:uncharacterized protein YecE (DUF72 family)